MKSCTLVLACLVATGASASDNCETIRASIEARIRAAGVTDPVVTVVDAAQSAPGQVVGHCGMGSRKIIHIRTGVPPRSATPILTECRDGSTPQDGVCSR